MGRHTGERRRYGSREPKQSSEKPYEMLRSQAPD